MMFVLLFAVIVVTLYHTFAIDVSTNDGANNITDIGYSFNANDGATKSVVVKAGKTKYFDFKIVNTNGDTIKYGVIYDNTNMSNVTVRENDNSVNPVTGLIESNDDGIYISIEITNNNNSDKTVVFSVVTGYENGGNLIIPSNHSLVSS